MNRQPGCGAARGIARAIPFRAKPNAPEERRYCAPHPILQKTRGYPAPEGDPQHSRRGLMVDIDTALRIESRYMTSLVIHPVSKNMIRTFFFQMGEIKSGKSRPENIARVIQSNLAILGAGLMGAGIAYASALARRHCGAQGRPLSRTQGKAQSPNCSTNVSKKAEMTPQRRDEVLGKITPTADATALTGCELVIEAVFEKRELKAARHPQPNPFWLSGIMASNVHVADHRPGAGLGTPGALYWSTSCGRQNAAGRDHQGTSDLTRDARTRLRFRHANRQNAHRRQRQPPGFFASRVFRTFRNEGLGMLAEGLNPAMIENASLQVGMPVGPLAVADEVSMALSCR